MACRTFRLDDQGEIDFSRFTSQEARAILVHILGCIISTVLLSFGPELTNPAGAPKEELMNFTGLPLTSTFIHLPGISLRLERELWSKGILDWHQFQEAVAVGKLTAVTTV
jgi:hypothetical protein